MRLPNLTRLHLALNPERTPWGSGYLCTGITYSAVFSAFSNLLPLLNPTHLALNFGGTFEVDESFEE